MDAPPNCEAVVSRTIEMCVDHDVDFSDAPNTAGVDGLGDSWDNNSVDRAGIGLAFELDTDVTTYSGSYRLCETENLGPATLSNLYVEMCPSEWRESDTTVFLVGCLATAGDLPRVRLDIAADHLGIDSQVDNHADRLDH